MLPCHLFLEFVKSALLANPGLKAIPEAAVVLVPLRTVSVCVCECVSVCVCVCVCV